MVTMLCDNIPIIFLLINIHKRIECVLPLECASSGVGVFRVVLTPLWCDSFVVTPPQHLAFLEAMHFLQSQIVLFILTSLCGASCFAFTYSI